MIAQDKEVCLFGKGGGKLLNDNDLWSLRSKLEGFVQV